MKVSYKDIKCNKDWDKECIDYYYELSATNFISAEELTASHVFCVILRGLNKRRKSPDFVR